MSQPLNPEEADVEWLCDDLQDLLELTHTYKWDLLFIIGDWNTKVRSQEIPGVIGKFGLGVQKSNRVLPREHTCYSKHPLLIKPVNPKGNQSCIFIEKTDAEAEAPILWPPDAKSRLTGKDPDAGQDWRQEEKGKTEDEMVGWHHWLDGHEFGWTPGDGEGQG